MASEPILCPSARCAPGAILLGIVLPDGSVAMAQDRIIVDEAFVQTAQEGRPPERRFRFSSPCAQGGCRQWTGERCGVIDAVLAETPPEASLPNLPECAIRSQCRWYQQSGESACHLCPLVITDSRPQE